MCILDLFTKLYSALYKRRFLPQKLHAQVIKVTRFFANMILPKYLLLKKHESNNDTTLDVIVSLTSFPARINTVWQVIECMKLQSVQPRKILLWLSKKQFPTEDHVPSKLREMEDEIFEIRYVEEDFRSHKKYYYACKEYPNDLIFLIDDDLYYPTDILERSYKTFINNENSIICNYGYEITFNRDRTHKPYSKWSLCYQGAEGKNLFFGSGGGTLFKPSSLFRDLTNIEMAINLAPLADDIWLNAMVKLAGLSTIIQKGGLILPIYTNSEALATYNRDRNNNDIQIANVEKEYGNIFNQVC